MKTCDVDSSTILSNGLVLCGEVNFRGGLQVDGNVKGTLKATSDKEPGRLVIGDTGQIEGDIEVPDIVINGKVRGNVYANRSINLGVNAVVDGDITYQVLKISPGAAVNGKLLRIEMDPEIAVVDDSSSSRKPS